MTGVKIKLDKERTLRFTTKAIAAFERKIGKPFSKIDDFDDLYLDEKLSLIWAGLLHEDKDLTVDGVFDLIDDHSDIFTVMESIGEALEMAFSSEEENSTAGE